jgi:predicted enzyme related to lactoylglutathione lyase
MANLLVWADLPVKDMARARKFYAHLLGNEIPEIPGQEGKVALLMPQGTGDAMDAAVDIATVSMTEPSTTHGPVIYLSAKGDIDGMLARAVEAGARIIQDKQDMGQFGGWLAFIEDSEGNLIGLQQPSGTQMSE